MVKEWQELMRMTGNEELTVERVRVKTKDIVIEGEFELPALAKLPFDDQVFISAFVKTHGSIKEMERIFGVSYPTIKSRLNRLADQFDFAKAEPVKEEQNPLAQLERGEISVQEALARLKK